MAKDLIIDKFRFLLGVLFRSHQREVSNILMFHRVMHGHDRYDIESKAFQDLLLQLSSMLRPIPLEENAEKRVIGTFSITFDDGCESIYEQFESFFRPNKIPCCVFVIVGKIGSPGYLSSAQLDVMAKSGLVEIGIHGFTHAPMTSSFDDTRSELVKCLQALDALGVKARFLSWPHGLFSSEALSCAEELGLRTFCSDATDQAGSRGRIDVWRSDNFATVLLKLAGKYNLPDVFT